MTIRRLQRDYSSVGVIDSGIEEEDISYCSTCMAVGQLVRLKERVWLDDKGKRLPDPPDADQYRQCWSCGNIIAVREAKLEGKISGIQGVETVDNPYDVGKGVILGNDSSLKNRYKNLKRQKTKHPDKEVQKLIDKGWEVTSYKTSMPV